jgi:hypothetical protein
VIDYERVQNARTAPMAAATTAESMGSVRIPSEVDWLGGAEEEPLVPAREGSVVVAAPDVAEAVELPADWVDGAVEDADVMVTPTARQRERAAASASAMSLPVHEELMQAVALLMNAVSLQRQPSSSAEQPELGGATRHSSAQVGKLCLRRRLELKVAPAVKATAERTVSANVQRIVLSGVWWMGNLGEKV